MNLNSFSIVDKALVGSGLVLLAIFIVGITVSAANTTIYVKDPLNRPIEGAVVEVEDMYHNLLRSHKTSRGGRVMFPRRECVLIISKDGYDPVEYYVAFVWNRYNIVLQPIKDELELAR